MGEILGCKSRARERECTSTASSGNRRLLDETTFMIDIQAGNQTIFRQKSLKKLEEAFMSETLQKLRLINQLKGHLINRFRDTGRVSEEALRKY